MLDNYLSERTVSGLHDALIKSLPQLDQNTPILDIGCGTGAWLERLAGLGFNNLYGVDIDIKQVQTCKANIFRANLDYDQVDLNCKFGLITAIEIVEHLENPGRVFNFVQHNLDQNGYLLLTTPNIHSLNCRLKFLLTGKLASFDENGDQTHIYPVLIDALQRILGRYSLQITKKWSYPEKGSLIYRSSTQLISSLLGTILPNENHGDTLCLLIQRKCSNPIQALNETQREPLLRDKASHSLVHRL